MRVIVVVVVFPFGQYQLPEKLDDLIGARLSLYLLPIEYSLLHAFPQRPVPAATTTDTPRTMLLASGQALLTGLQSSTFYVSYILMSTAGLIISSVMLRSIDIFSKVTVYVGILEVVLGLGLFVPTIGLLLSLISVIPTLMWYILIGSKAFPTELSRLFERRYVSKGL